MNITHVTMHFFPIHGGQEIYIATLNSILRNAGIEVSVIQPSRPKNENKPNYVHYVPRLRLSRLMKGIDWLWFNLMLIKKKSFLEKQDILISHYPFHYPAVRWHKNVIVVSHGLYWSEPPRLIFDKYKKYSAFMAKKKKVLIVSNDTCFLRSIGIEAKEGEQYFSEISKNVWFIPNCVDTNKFCFKNTQRKNIILVPRNIRKSRGIHLAIEAFRLFSQNNRDFTMKIVGRPLSGEYYDYCSRLIRSYFLENSIHFLGNISNDNLIDIYNEAKITLIPTIDFEGTSLSALESMACKTPVVSTRVGGLLDLPTWKVGKSPEEVSNGLESILSVWKEESEKQYYYTTNTFNLDNWGNAWMFVIKSFNS